MNHVGFIPPRTLRGSGVVPRTNARFDSRDAGQASLTGSLAQHPNEVSGAGLAVLNDRDQAYKINTALATMHVHKPFLSPIADWVMFDVWTILPDIL